MNWGVSAGVNPPGGELEAHMQFGGAQFDASHWYQGGMAAGNTMDGEFQGQLDGELPLGGVKNPPVSGGLPERIVPVITHETRPHQVTEHSRPPSLSRL